jgi:hypothetical protein
VLKADNLPPSCAVVTKSGSLNFLEPSGSVQACNGTALLVASMVLSPGDSGYFSCIQNMKLVTNKFKLGGLHEKHVVATWNFENYLSICLYTQGNQANPVSRWPVAGPSEY